MPFPANYGQTYSRTASYADSTFDLSWQLLTAIQTDQPSSCVVDGYGTLKIPGREAACLRLNIDLSGVTSDTGVVAFDGMGILMAGAPTGVPHEARVAGGFALYQNYPNPFNPTTVISGQLTADRDMCLVIYDLLGREIAVLAEGKYQAGRFAFTFDGQDFASGVYVYRLTAGQYSASRTMTLIK